MEYFTFIMLIVLGPLAIWEISKELKTGVLEMKLGHHYRDKQPFQYWLGIVLQSIIVLVAIISSLFLVMTPYKFDSEAWKQAGLEYEQLEKSGNYDGTDLFKPLKPHRKMVSSLIRSEILLGKNKQEVAKLLGMEHNDFEDNQWNYWLNFTIADNKWLGMDFIDNKVSNVYIWEG
jgi:hypothetical protein